jgi:hypothetical protein
MPVLRVDQRKWTKGELDPEMLSRGDVEPYYGAASRLLNVFTLPQGGIQRSPGLKWVGRALKRVTRATPTVITAPNGGITYSANDNNLITSLSSTTPISTINPYVLVQYDLGASIRVGYIRVSGLRSDYGSVANVILQRSVDGVVWTNIRTDTLSATDLNYTARVQTNARYVRIARIGTTDETNNLLRVRELEVWSEASESNIKFINFEFNTEDTYLLVVTEFNIAVYRNSVYQVDIYAPQLFNSKIPYLNWTQNADALILVEQTMQPIKITRLSNTNWNVETIQFDFIPKYDYVQTEYTPTGHLTPDAVSGNVKCVSQTDEFLSGDVNKYIEGNGGLGRIVRYINSKTVICYMEIPFFNTDNIAVGSWKILGDYVSVWGGGYGWPKTAVFYEGRLWFGGSQSRPRTVWGSRVNDFFNFDPGTALDTDAVTIDVAGSNNELNSITAIFGGRNLLVFTTGASYAFIKSVDEVITQSNAYLPPQTNIGAAENVKLADIEGVVFYVQRGGSSLRQFVYTDTEAAYTSPIASRLSSHLFKVPKSMSLRKAISTNQGSYLLIVNEDGSLTIANISTEEEIFSFFERQTSGGVFLESGTVFDRMYVAVRRGTEIEIEEFDFNHILDSSTRITTGLPAQSFSGLDYLNGKTVKVWADNKLLSDVTISNGIVTIATPASNFVEFGFDFTPVIKDLPLTKENSEARLGIKRHVNQIHLRVYSTTSLNVNGNEVDFFKITNTPKTNALSPYTGVVSVYGNRGWDNDGIITITQTKPGFMEILEISKFVDT